MKKQFTLALALATTLTFTACEEKKKQDGTTPEPAAAETQEAASESQPSGEQKCPNAITGNGTLTCGGQTYKTVKIGNQTWMAENLNYQPNTGNSWCYDDKADNCKKYGRLYDLPTALEVCPAGWKLPSQQEWDNLVTVAGGQETSGKKLKSKSGWILNDENISGTDDFGFSALPGGGRYGDGYFNHAGSGGSWHTADGGGYAADEQDSFFRIEYVDEDDYDSYGYSVRCVQN